MEVSMADSLNTPTLSKLHQSLSRRSLMREMAAGAAIAVVSAPAIAAPMPSAHERLKSLIAELQSVAREVNPAISDWKISIADYPGQFVCPLLIAAFESDERSQAGAKRNRRSLS
jgi:hypothetical protein